MRWFWESGNLSWYLSSRRYFTVTRLPRYHWPKSLRNKLIYTLKSCSVKKNLPIIVKELTFKYLPCKVLKTFPASSVFWALTYTQPSAFSVSTAIWSINAGGLTAEHRRRISSFTCQIQPLPTPFADLDEFFLIFWGSNMCLIFKQDVGAMVGAATLRFKLLNAAPCHWAEMPPLGDVIGVDEEFGWNSVITNFQKICQWENISRLICILSIKICWSACFHLIIRGHRWGHHRMWWPRMWYWVMIIGYRRCHARMRQAGWLNSWRGRVWVRIWSIVGHRTPMDVRNPLPNQMLFSVNCLDIFPYSWFGFSDIFHNSRPNVLFPFTVLKMRKTY